MVKNRRLLSLVAAAGATLALAVGGTLPASADPPGVAPGTPPNGLNPSDYYVGVGADAFAELTNNFAAAYNATSPTHQLFSYDAVNPVTGAQGEVITPKAGCSVIRPNGANAGLSVIKGNNATDHVDGDTSKPWCVDFVRSSRAKGGTDGALTFYAQSRDAVSYAVLGNAYAPTTPLTTDQLKKIFTCQITDWSEVGGQAGTIHLYLPPTSAATYTFFLTALGGLVPQNVTDACGSPGPTNTTVFNSQQNDGRSTLGDPQGITPYAVTKWAAQTNGAPGISDFRGGVQIGLINTPTSPFTTATLSGDPKTYLVLNPAFTDTAGPSKDFGRLFFNVVRNGGSPAPPADLAAAFSNTGYLCQHSADLLVPFGNAVLSNSTGASEYCGQVS